MPHYQSLWKNIYFLMRMRNVERPQNVLVQLCYQLTLVLQMYELMNTGV